MTQYLVQIYFFGLVRRIYHSLRSYEANPTTGNCLIRDSFFDDLIHNFLLDYAPTRSEVVNWYLEEIADDIDTEEELLEKKSMIEKVKIE